MTVLFSTSARPAEACSCFANPPCAAVWQADAVFIGTVVEKASERIGGSLSWTVHKVAVGQPLLGSIDSFVTLVPGHPPTAEDIERSKSYPNGAEVMSSCDYSFEVGRQYVIYARRTPDGRWTTAQCTGTKPVEEATADLDYIASIPAAEPTGRVYGTVERIVLDRTDPSGTTNVPAADVQIALVSGTNRLTTTTDKDGKIDVQVQPGEYTIAPVVPETVLVYGAPHETSVPARGCAPVGFTLTANGRIEGRVLRSDGTPVPDVSVDVVPADLPPGKRPEDPAISPSGRTDDHGRFSVDAILPGRYVVAVNALFGPRLTAPYPTTYFPGAGRQDAHVVEMGEGERKTGFTIVVNPLSETTLTGVVVFDNDLPVAKARVTVEPVDHPWAIMRSARTDDGGAFELRLLAGISYLVRATIRTEHGLRETEAVIHVGGNQEGLRLSIAR